MSRQAFGHVAAHLVGAIRAYREVPPLRGKLVASWSVPFFPWFIAVSPDGTEVFVTDFDNDHVYVYSAQGVWLRRWGSSGSGPGRLSNPHGIAVTSGGEVVVANRGNDCVQMFRPDGTFLRQWGARGSSDGEFSFLSDVTVTPAGTEVIVAEDGNRRIQVFRLSDGAFVRRWGRRDSPHERRTNFDAVRVTTTGQVRATFVRRNADQKAQVLVADGFNHCVLVFSQQGTLLHKWGSKGSCRGQFNNPLGVAVRGNQVLVADSNNHRLQVLRADGTTVQMVEDPRHGNFMYPVGLAVTRIGQVLVCDRYNMRVHVFE